MVWFIINWHGLVLSGVTVTWVKCPAPMEKPIPCPYLQTCPSSYQPSTAAWYRSPPDLGKGGVIVEYHEQF